MCNYIKYAQDSNGERILPSKGRRGRCEICGSELIARCGPKNIHHWSHKSKIDCDPWWENKTDWHRNWQNAFPNDWQEVVHHDSKGEQHRADVKTDEGWIIEFQHSPIKPEEIHARNDFYRSIVWVVDGTTRKNDFKQFQDRLNESNILYKNPKLLEIYYPEECRLISDWHDPNALVFFDFNDLEPDDGAYLWFLFPKTSKQLGYIARIKRMVFIEWFVTNSFNEVVKESIIPLHKEILLEVNKMGIMQHSTIKKSLEYFGSE